MGAPCARQCLGQMAIAGLFQVAEKEWQGRRAERYRLLISRVRRDLDTRRLVSNLFTPSAKQRSTRCSRLSAGGVAGTVAIGASPVRTFSPSYRTSEIPRFCARAKWRNHSPLGAGNESNGAQTSAIASGERPMSVTFGTKVGGATAWPRFVEARWAGEFHPGKRRRLGCVRERQPFLGVVRHRQRHPLRVGRDDLQHRRPGVRVHRLLSRPRDQLPDLFVGIDAVNADQPSAGGGSQQRNITCHRNR